MSDYRWACKRCGHLSPDAPAVLTHTDTTGHRGVALVWPLRPDRRPVIARRPPS